MQANTEQTCDSLLDLLPVFSHNFAAINASPVPYLYCLEYDCLTKKNIVIMKKQKMLYAILFLFSMLLSSCSSDNSEYSIGLSSNKVTFGKEGGTQELTTQANSWWIETVKLNDADLRTDPSVKYTEDKYGCPIEVVGESFSIQKTEAGLRIKVSPIANETSRELEITLQDHDFFDYVQVYQ